MSNTQLRAVQPIGCANVKMACEGADNSRAVTRNRLRESASLANMRRRDCPRLGYIGNQLGDICPRPTAVTMIASQNLFEQVLEVLLLRDGEASKTLVELV